jgi:hypothetical protein
MSRGRKKSEIPVQCPRCEADAVSPILYGFPTPEAEGAAARGEIELGGCVVSDEAPIWRCARCGAEGGRRGE